MRSIVWFLVLAVTAVVGATALGANDGLVTIYWLGWRADMTASAAVLIVFSVGVFFYALGLPLSLWPSL